MFKQVFNPSLQYPLLFTAGIVVLATHPVVWLVGTWIDPAYASHGFLVAGLVLGLLVWSAQSPRRSRTDSRRHRAVILLTLTAGVRLLGQLLGVNVIGAIALVLDVYALGLLLGLDRRQRSLSPAWLAVLFAFSLPLERIVQRTIGFGLQQISAAGACQALSLGPDPVQCEGVRILLAGQDVLVDLPCSGARGLLLLLLLFTALAALNRPTPLRAILGLVITLMAAAAANVIRIVLLALGLAYPEILAGIAVMETPWHEGIGLIVLLLGATPVFLCLPHSSMGCVDTQSRRTRWSVANPIATLAHGNEKITRLASLSFLICTTIIISLPAHPIDVARRAKPITLPAVLAEYRALPGALSAPEQAYFTRYGGSAARASYGPYALLVVSTSAPLRHLHAPDECLTGAGHRVRYLGSRYALLPTAIYRSIDPQGRRWQVAVTFMSDRGELATSVTEAVWRWLHNPGSTWTMVQRIAPWDMPSAELDGWDTAVAQALDLPYRSATTLPYQFTHSLTPEQSL